MGKFGVKGDKERFKAAAKSKKKEIGKGDGSTSKRKESEVEPSQKPKQSKKARTETDPSVVEPKKKKPSSSSVVVGLPAESAPAAEQPSNANPNQPRMKEFMGVVSKAFLRSSFEESFPSDSSQAKLQLSFNRIISGLYAQFEAMSSLGLAEGPLKEKIDDLERRQKEAEAKFDKVKEALERAKASNSDLRSALTESESARQEISIELEGDRERFELEAQKSREQLIELQGLVARQCEEIEQLRIGEGVDLEAFIESDAFEGIKDSIEDATGEELIRRIKEIHPDLDLSFLTVSESNSPPAPNDMQENDDKQAEPDNVDPTVADEGGAA